MADKDLQVRFGVGHLSYQKKQRTRITYKSPTQITGDWISENCSSAEWYPLRGEGVLNLRRDVDTIGGGASIDYSPFYGNTSVTEVVLPNEITNIGDYAFDGCTNLEKVVVTSEVPPTLGDNVFEDTTTVYVPYEYLDAYGEAWGDEVDIAPIGNYYQITVTAGEHGSATGSGWYALNESVVLTATADEGYEFTQWGDGNTDNPRTITVLGDATYTCAFQSIAVQAQIRYTSTNQASGLWVTNNTDTTRNTYDSVTGNGVLYLNSGVTSIGGGYSTDYTPFYEDTGLTAVDLSDAGLTTIGDSAFSDCSGLTSVTIGSGVMSIGDDAFYQCYGLTSVNIPSGVTSIGVAAFDYCSSLTSITIPSSVTSIGSSAFESCSSLTSITIPNTVLTLGDYAFNNCTALTSFTCGAGEIGQQVCYGCTDLATVTLTSGVTSIGQEAFKECYNLTSVTLPNGLETINDYAFSHIGVTSLTIPSTVTYMGYEMFSYCDSLESVTISEGVTEIGMFAFQGCYNLDSLSLPSTLTTIGDCAFSECTGLTSVTIPSGVTSIGASAFYCENLTSVTCEATTPPTLGNANFNASNDTLYIPYASLSAYQNDSEWSAAFDTIRPIGNYAYITVSAGANGSASGSGWYVIGATATMTATPDSGYEFTQWNDGNTSNPRTITVSTDATYTCAFQALKQIRYTSTRQASGTWVTNNTDTTKNTYDSTTHEGVLYLNEGVTEIGGGNASTDYSPFCQDSGLTSVDLDNAGLTSIGSYTFYYCSGLTSVNIPNTVTSIGYYAFHHCIGLTTVTGLENTSVTTLNATFEGCTNLTSVTLPNTLTTLVGDGIYNHGVFYGCTSLASITIPSSVRTIGVVSFVNCTSLSSVTFNEGLTTIEDRAFSNCTSLTSVTLPSTLTSIGNNAFAATGLTSITVASGNTTYNDGNGSNCIIKTSNNTLVVGCKTTVIPNTVTSIGDNAFGSCSGLTSITIPNTVTSIGTSAFYGCTALTSVNIPNSVTSIGVYAFGSCSGLTSATIGNGVTTIAQGAFGSCSGLTSVTIPSTVTSIVSWAFGQCTSLASITIPSSVNDIGAYAFGGCTVLTSVTCEATTPPTLGSNNFGATNDTLYVPAASVSAYQSDSSWSSAFTTITAIPTPTPPQIRYTTGDPQYGASAVDGNWVTNNTDTTQNTYATVAGQYGNIGEGVLYLNSGVTTIGGGQSTAYSPFYESGLNHWTDGIDLSDSGLISIGDYGLYDCYADFDPSNPLVIPEGVTTIGDHGLGASTTGGSDCYYDLPSTLTSIASNGIYIGGTKGGIAVLICRAATPPTLGTNSISAPDGLWELKVPAASVSAYQSSAWGSLGFTTITAIS